MAGHRIRTAPARSISKCDLHPYAEVLVYQAFEFFGGLTYYFILSAWFNAARYERDFLIFLILLGERHVVRVNAAHQMHRKPTCYLKTFGRPGARKYYFREP